MTAFRDPAGSAERRCRAREEIALRRDRGSGAQRCLGRPFTAPLWAVHPAPALPGPRRERGPTCLALAAAHARGRWCHRGRAMIKQRKGRVGPWGGGSAHADTGI